jgi:hypothetical protein
MGKSGGAVKQARTLTPLAFKSILAKISKGALWKLPSALIAPKMGQTLAL